MKKTFDKISLSPNTVAQRINEISEDIEKGLINRCHGFEAFSIAADEGTGITDNAQCAIFVRGVDKNLNVTEELLDLIQMKSKTTGADILSVLERVVEHAGLPWEKFVWLQMVRHQWWDVRAGLLVDRGQNSLHYIINRFAAVHFILYQEALCGRSLQMKSVMEIVPSAVNFIRSRTLNYRQFVSLLEAVGSEYGEILYHTEVRWLSPGRVLKRLFDL